MAGQSLQAYLKSGIFAKNDEARQLATIIGGLAKGAIEVRKHTTQGALNAGFGTTRGTANADGDIQKDLDVIADDIFLQEMRKAAVAIYASEETALPILLDPDKPYALAIDPLDGSSNIETNISIGTIFSVIPVAGDPRAEPEASIRQPGTRQVAAGFFIYGPQMALVLTAGVGVSIFIHSAKHGDFMEAADSVVIPKTSIEFAINASNYRHWFEPVRSYIDDLFSGKDGPREKDFNMRWLASLVGDAHRILVRGGVFIYPADKRKGYERGRLRHVYEAAPMAFVMEQAAGGAIDGFGRILDKVPTALHERTPLIFGSTTKVERLRRYHTDPDFMRDQTALFGSRGFYRS